MVAGSRTSERGGDISDQFRRSRAESLRTNDQYWQNRAAEGHDVCEASPKIRGWSRNWRCYWRDRRHGSNTRSLGRKSEIESGEPDAVWVDRPDQ